MVETTFGFQLLSEPCPRTVEPDLYRVQGYAGDLGDLGIRETFELAQDKNAPVVIRKTFHDAAVALIHVFPDQQCVENRGAVIRHGAVRRCIVIRRDVREIKDLSRCKFSQMIRCRVRRDTVDPGGQ